MRVREIWKDIQNSSLEKPVWFVTFKHEDRIDKDVFLIFINNTFIERERDYVSSAQDKGGWSAAVRASLRFAPDSWCRVVAWISALFSPGEHKNLVFTGKTLFHLPHESLLNYFPDSSSIPQKSKCWSTPGLSPQFLRWPYPVQLLQSPSLCFMTLSLNDHSRTSPSSSRPRYPAALTNIFYQNVWEASQNEGGKFELLIHPLYPNSCPHCKPWLMQEMALPSIQGPKWKFQGAVFDHPFWSHPTSALLTHLTVIKIPNTASLLMRLYQTSWPKFCPEPQNLLAYHVLTSGNHLLGPEIILITYMLIRTLFFIQPFLASKGSDTSSLFLVPPWVQQLWVLPGIQ